MRSLKIIVVVLGVALVGGTLTLIGALVWRGSHRAPGADPAGTPYSAILALPAGAEVESIQTAGDRLVLLIRSPAGRQMVVLDPRSGRTIGTIALRPAAPGGE